MYEEFENKQEQVEIEPEIKWQADDYQKSKLSELSRPLYDEGIIETLPKKKNNFLRYTAVGIAGMFAGAIIFAGAAAYTSGKVPKSINTPQISNSQGATGTQVSTLVDGALSIVDIAKKAGPSVVGVVNKRNVNTFFGTQSEEQGGGSGIIIKSDGYIITNNHVIEGSTDVTVVLNTGKEYTAKIIGSDAKTDLAVIKIDATELLAADLGKSSELEVGEVAVAIGNPMGQEFAGSVTAGVISALNRTMNVQGRQYTLVQTDAAINPGNSGGALVNKFGKVIGINTVKIGATGFEGMGFAIPIDEAMPVINELLDGGYVKGRPIIGISPREITPQMAKRYNMPEGIYVLEVSPFSGAEKAGFKVSDVIIKADGTNILTIDQLNKARDKHKAGETMTFDVIREGQTKTFKVVLGEEKPSN